MSEGLSVTAAKLGEKPILAELMQAYLAGFAEFEDVEQDADGRYHYPYLAFYWEDPNRYPFLFRDCDQVVGFALCRFDIDPVSGRESMEVAEFYVDPQHRRQGLGREAATRLWDLFPGRWVARVLKSNKNAIPFWRTIIDKYTEGRFEEQRPATPVGGAITFAFESKTSAGLPDNVEPDHLDF